MPHRTITSKDPRVLMEYPMVAMIKKTSILDMLRTMTRQEVARLPVANPLIPTRYRLL